MKGRKTINRIGGVVLLGGLGLYGVGFWYSLRKVDGFCMQVERLSVAADITALAQKLGVRYQEAPDDRNASKRVGFVASDFTFGDYACRVDIAAGKVVSAKILKN